MKHMDFYHPNGGERGVKRHMIYLYGYIALPEIQFEKILDSIEPDSTGHGIYITMDSDYKRRSVLLMAGKILV